MSHTDDCAVVPDGFGDLPFGSGPFGSRAPEGTSGGPLPNDETFDIYAVLCGDIANTLTHPEVTFVQSDGQTVVDPYGPYLILGSGGNFPTTDVRMIFGVNVPPSFTWEVIVYFTSLPHNFNDLTNRHVFLGSFDNAGNAASLFVSEVGLLYTGAVHFNGDAIVLDHPTQPLPNSEALIELGEFFTIRMTTSQETGTTFIYWTRTEDVSSIGHQLRYVIPALPMATATTSQPDSSLFSVRGTISEPSMIAFEGLSLGTGLIMPNLPPRAVANPDQALRNCAIAQFDGSGSYDPEGSPVTYQWRLIDAPTTSSFAFESLDAKTYPESSPTGFTDQIYSADLATAHAADPVLPGDVISLAGEVYEVASTGSDTHGFFVDVGDNIVPDSFSTGQPFKLLRQRGLSGGTTVNPTFLPDLPGLFKFDLTVSDGQLFSEPAITVINVTESPLPRGLTPDLKFIWDYLGDFWRLVEDRARIETFWGALAQVAATELLTLWQIDYSKNLRDVQRTFQRRWLHYDLLMQESPGFLELSTVRAVYGGLRSSTLAYPGATLNVTGQVLTVFLPYQTTPISITLHGTNPLTPDAVVTQLNAALQAVNPAIVAKVIANRAATQCILRIDAPFALSVSGTSTFTLFGVSANHLPTGTGGFVTGTRAYKVEQSLAQVDIQAGDLLVLGSGAYRIARVIDDTTDALTYQRIVLSDDLPADAGANWIIAGSTVSQTLDFYDALFTAGDVANLEVVDITTGLLSYASVPVLGVCAAASNTLAIDTSQLGHYINQPSLFSVYFVSALRRQYTPIDPLIVDVPYLQEIIKNSDDEAVIRRNIDYFIEEFRGQHCIRFVVNNDVTLDIWEGLAPPERLWAEVTYVDNRPVIEANFGIPAEFTLDDLSELPNNIDYLSAVRGLWYAYLSGPTLFNVRAGVQILLGLPFAEVASTIEEIRDDFSTTQGRLLLRDIATPEIVRSYSYPHGLVMDTNPDTKLPYAVGDTVKQFAPIVTGAYVADWVKDPSWFQGLLNQGSFAEIEKYAKFLVQVDSSAFNLDALLFIRQFVLRIKPTYLFPLFIVRADLGDAEVSVSDSITYRGVLSSYAGPGFGTDGQAQMFDQPRPGGGGFWDQLDRADPNGTAPTIPTSDPYVDWGMDEYLLAPQEIVFAQLKKVLSTPTPPTADSIFLVDLPVFTGVAGIFTSGIIRNVKTLTPIGPAITSAVTGTLTKVQLAIQGFAEGREFNLVIKKNGTTVATIDFFQGWAGLPNVPTRYLQLRYNFDVSIPVTTSDVLTVFLTDVAAGEYNTWIECLGVIVGIGQDWHADTALPAGTYFTYVVL